MRSALLLAVLLPALAACDTQEMTDRAVARAAEAVVAPVLGDLAARCVVANATRGELHALARDIGVEAGTSTFATIAAISGRPGTLACFAREGVSPPRS